MYRVDYYTLETYRNPLIGELETGNIKQFSDVMYTEIDFSDIQDDLNYMLEKVYGENKYVGVITQVTKIKGNVGRLKVK